MEGGKEKMKIVTISREYGSGGRELGKRLAAELGFSYYDKEILKELAARTDLDENYVEKLLDNGIKPNYGVSFHGSTFVASNVTAQTDVLVAEQKLVKEIGSKCDCVIVGRNASVALSEHRPFRIFVYGDAASKIARCRKRSPEDNALSDKELAAKMKRMDAARAKIRRLTAGTEWGEYGGYDLMVNTSNADFDKIVPAIAEFARLRFENKD